MSFKFNMDWLKGAAASAVTFSKKNAPALMTGGGILLFWGSMYMFWQESKRAEKAIAYKEVQLQSTINVEEGEDPVKVMKERSELPKKEKAIIYLEYCWLSLAMGLGATGLLIFAQKVSIDRLLGMYATAQFFEKQVDEKNSMISKLKEKAGIKDGSKADEDLKKEVLKEEYPKERVEALKAKAKGTGKTCVIDRVNGYSYYKDIISLTEGISTAANLLDKSLEKAEEKCRTRKKKKSLLNDPYFAKSDNVWEIMAEDADSTISEYKSNDCDPNVYGTLDVETFYECIGEIVEGNRRPCEMGEMLEFRKYNGGRDKNGNKIDTNPIKISRIIQFDDEYLDPDSGFPLIVWLDYGNLLSPTSELLERDVLTN